MNVRRVEGLLLAGLCVLLWGSSFVAVKLALRSIAPLDLVTWRALIGAGFLAAAVAPRLQRRWFSTLSRGDVLRIGVLALLGVPVQLGLQAYGLTLTTAVNSGWLVALIPVFTAILAAIFLGERFPRRKVAGVALGFAGALLVVSRGMGLRVLALPSTAGDALVLLSALNWACYNLVARDLMTRRRPLPTTTLALAMGTMVMLPADAVLGSPGAFPQWTPMAWVALLFLGLGCTGAGYLAWSAALERVEAGTASSVQYVQPLVTLGVARLLLGEPVPAASLLGGGLVLLGVYLVQSGARAVARTVQAGTAGSVPPGSAA